LGLKIGRSRGIRTLDTLLPKQVLYQAELYSDVIFRLYDLSFEKSSNLSIGQSGEVRTHDPLAPDQMRYQAALLTDYLVGTVGFEPTSFRLRGVTLPIELRTRILTLDERTFNTLDCVQAAITLFK
jgi:hypothetical protein